jgi:hypothetical protein
MQMKRPLWPHSFLGMLAVILAFCTIALMIYTSLAIIFHPQQGGWFNFSQLYALGITFILVFIPSILTIVLSSLAIKLKSMRDPSRMVRVALVIGIVLAIVSIPAGLGIDRLLR